MTSQTIPASFQHDLEGRSVRDVVAASPELVDDAWCRKVLRKILPSLSLQYAMQMPHRAITIDTIVFHANGEPLLISDDIDADPAPDARQADDLAALAGVLHFAITHEPVPAGPLGGRVNGYGAALLATLDACMDPDPARRPRSIDAALGLLDTAAPGPLAGAVAPPAPDVPAAPLPSATAFAGIVIEPYHGGGGRPGRRWAFAAGGGAVAIALALVLFNTWHTAGPVVFNAATPPPPVSATPAAPPEQGSAAAVAPVAVDARQASTSAPVEPNAAGSTAADSPVTEEADSPAIGASSNGTTGSGAPNPVAAKAPPAVPAPAAVARSVVSSNASYQLQIKPWGTVYVDGVERGVSPPVKRLSLTPGRHTIRITNPEYRDSVLEFESAATTSNGKIIVDFTREEQ